MSDAGETQKTIVVIGYGHAGQRHARILREQLGCLVYVYDKGIAHTIAIEDGVLPVPLPFEDVMDRADGVVVAVPPAEQWRLACRAILEHGKRVFVEKPCPTLRGVTFPLTTGDRDLLTVGYQLRADVTLAQFVRGSFTHARIIDHQDMAAWPPATYPRDILWEFSHEIDTATRLLDGPQVLSAWQPTPLWVIVKLRDRAGRRTLDLSLSAGSATYERGIWLYDASDGTVDAWAFSRERNEACYVEQLRAWLAGKPYCDATRWYVTEELIRHIREALHG